MFDLEVQDFDTNASVRLWEATIMMNYIIYYINYTV